jgi:hypothetical protein
MEAVVLGKLEHNVDCLILASIIDNQDLISAKILLRSVSHMSLSRGTRSARPSLFGSAKVFIKISDSLFEGRNNAIFFVVGWEDDAQAHFGGLDVSSIGSRECFIGADVLLASLSLSEPAVVPAGERLRLCASVSRMAGDVGLFGGVDGSRLWRDKMEDDIELGMVSLRCAGPLEGFSAVHTSRSASAIHAIIKTRRM